MNILFVGVGGVGGYFGGLVARYAEKREDVHVYFLARGAHLEAIRKEGLLVIDGDREQFTVRPAMVAAHPGEVGLMDYIFQCTKSYDLENALSGITDCMQPDTVLIPLLNGVDSRERIQQHLPEHLVCSGCAYIVSRLQSPGVVVNLGHTAQLSFGAGNSGTHMRLSELERVLQDAGVNGKLSDDITTEIWKKFVFLAPLATTTAFFNRTAGEVLASEESRAILHALLAEVVLLAESKGIAIGEDISSRTIAKIIALPLGATTSMHQDFKKGKAVTELDTLAGYVVREAGRMEIAVPVFTSLYSRMSEGRIYKVDEG